MESTPLLDTQPPVITYRRLVTIEPVLFLFSLYFAGSVPLIDQFVESQLKQRYNFTVSDIQCGVSFNYSTADQIKAEASTWLIYMNVAVMIPSFFSTVLLGSYSDATGRKVALVPPLVGASVRLLILIAIVFFDLPLGLLILASLCDGFGGGICTMLMASFSYVSNVTGTRSRSIRIVLVELSGVLADVISFLFVGYAARLFGYIWTFVIFLGILFTALCYVVFALPEVSVISATTIDKRDFFTLEHFRRVVSMYVKDDADGSGRCWKLRFTLLAMGMTSALQLGSRDVQTFHMLSAPLCFTSVWVGYYFAASRLIKVLTTLAMTHIFVHYVGDVILMVVGFVFGTGDQLMFGLSMNRVMLFTGLFAGCAARLSIPLIRAYNSKIVKPDEIGLMFASLAWIQIVGALIGNVTQNAVFSATVGWMQSFVFMVNASTYFLAALLTMPKCFGELFGDYKKVSSQSDCSCQQGQTNEDSKDFDENEILVNCFGIFLVVCIVSCFISHLVHAQASRK